MIQGLGRRLQRLRIERNLSQKEVSNEINISATAISNYENGDRTPSVEALLTLARFYQCSTDYILGFEKYTPTASIDVSNLTEEQIELLKSFIASL